MKRNVGKADRIIRILIAVAAAILVFTNTVSGAGAIIVGLVGVIVLVTGVTGFCGLYAPFKIDTRKNKE